MISVVCVRFAGGLKRNGLREAGQFNRGPSNLTSHDEQMG